MNKIKVLEVNDIDLLGKTFNGYDFVEDLNDKEFLIKQCVLEKRSNNDNVVRLIENKFIREFHLYSSLSEKYSLYSLVSLSSPALIESISYKEADIIHFHMFHNTKLSLCSLKKIASEKNVIITMHDPWFLTGHCVHFGECNKWRTGCHNCKSLDSLFPLKVDTSNLQWNLKKSIFNDINVDIVVTSEWMKSIVEQSCIMGNQNIHLIPLGLDLQFFSNSIGNRKAKKHYGIPLKDVVLFFRSQDDFKGTKYIVEALKMLNVDIPITLITCSEIGNIDELKRKYNVIELGVVDTNEIIYAYNACDVFLMPSTGESFGMMAVEAMACSKPVVVFNNTALPSVTFAPKCGVLVNDKDSVDLKNKIQELIENKKYRLSRGKLSRKIACRFYDKDSYYERIRKLYRNVSHSKPKLKHMHNVFSKARNICTKILTKKTEYSSDKLIDLKMLLNDFSKDIFCDNIQMYNIMKYKGEKGKYNIFNIDFENSLVCDEVNKYNDKLYKNLIKKNRDE